jgi:hypothetical protein
MTFQLPRKLADWKHSNRWARPPQVQHETLPTDPAMAISGAYQGAGDAPSYRSNDSAGGSPSAEEFILAARGSAATDQARTMPARPPLDSSEIAGRIRQAAGALGRQSTATGEAPTASAAGAAAGSEQKQLEALRRIEEGLSKITQLLQTNRPPTFGQPE